MSDAVRLTCQRIEDLLEPSPAFRKIEERFYLVRQGSAFVYVHVVPWEPDRALVRFVAQLARGVEITPELALRLLRMNAKLRFGAFGWVQEGRCVTLQHTLLGGATLDKAEILSTLRDIAMLADEFDDWVVSEAGGKTMQALLQEHELEVLEREVSQDSSRHMRVAPQAPKSSPRASTRPPPKR
jgi:hypothetical protein